MRGLVPLAFCMLTGTAHAQLTDAEWQPEAEDEQLVAADAEPEKQRMPPFRPNLGVSVGGGAVWNATERVGWAGRIEYASLYSPNPPGPGAIVGARMGLELWKADGEGGGSLPTAAFFGFATPGFTMGLGFGLHTMLYDYRDDRGGFGLYAPFGMAMAGARFGKLAVLADVRMSYRWQWRAPDYRQTIAGIAVSWLLPIDAEPRAATSRSACGRAARAGSAGAPCGPLGRPPPPSP